MKLKIENTTANSSGKSNKPKRKKQVFTFKTADKGVFYAEMAMLLRSGIDLRSTLSIVYEETKTRKKKDFLKKLIDKIIEGQALSEVLKQESSISNYEYYSLIIGEETGNIISVLENLAAYYDKKAKDTKKVLGALLYPFIVLISAVLVVIFMLYYVVPMFEGVLTRFNGDLPSVTRMVINASAFMQANIVYIFLILALLIGVFFYLYKHKKHRYPVSRTILKIPIIGTFITKIYLYRFCQAMALLISSGIPMLRAIQLIRKMISWPSFEIAFQQVEEDIVNGEALYQSLKKQKLFDEKIVALTKVGEEVNQLEAVFQRLSAQFNDEVDQSIRRLNTFLEPALIIIVGGFVALILVAMYMPMFKIGNSFM